jgi:hypothetical protein
MRYLVLFPFIVFGLFIRAQQSTLMFQYINGKWFDGKAGGNTCSLKADLLSHCSFQEAVFCDIALRKEQF